MPDTVDDFGGIAVEDSPASVDQFGGIPVEAGPDFSKIKLSPYDQAAIAAFRQGRGKPESGMESGTELTTAVAENPLGALGTLASVPFRAVVGAAGAVVNPLLRRKAPEFGESQDEFETRRDPIQYGKSFVPHKETALQPEGTDAGRLLERWTTPEGILMIPAGMTRIGAMALMTQMAPGLVQQISETAKGEGSDMEKRDRINDLFALGALVAGGGARRGIQEGLKAPPEEAPMATGQALKMPKGATPPDLAATAEAVRAAREAPPAPPVAPEGVRTAPEAPAPAQAPAASATAPPEIAPEVTSFIEELRQPEIKPGGTNRATVAGLKATSIEELEALATEHARIKADLAKARADGNMDRAMIIAGKGQLPREAIEAAADVGSNTVEMDTKLRGGKPKYPTVRPLDWRTHPEVADWLRKNGARLNIALPDELKAPKVAATLPAPASEPVIRESRTTPPPEPTKPPAEARRTLGLTLEQIAEQQAERNAAAKGIRESREFDRGTQPPAAAPEKAAVGLSSPVDITKPAGPKRAYSGAAYQAPASEFVKLVKEHAMEHGWADNPDLLESGAEGYAAITHNAEMAKAFRRAFKQLGIETDRNTLKTKAEALPKLKAFLEAHAKTVPVPLDQMPDGSTFSIAGEPHTVVSTNPDTGIVTIKDGKTLKVDERGAIKIDPGSLKAAPHGDFTPTELAAGPEKGMAGPGTPSAAQGPDVGGGFQNQSGADIYGVAARVRADRAKSGQVAPIPTGQGVAAKEAVKWGQDLISMGVDPEKSMQEFERTRAVSFDLMAVGRGYGESLARTARSIEGKFGTDSNEYRMAQKALTDWDKRSKAMQTEWHKIGMAQQGETDIDTGSFTGISRAFKEATGQDFAPGQKKAAERIAKGVSTADKAAQAAKPNLQAEIDRIGAPVEPRVQRLAEKIIAAMDKKANDALARIKARQAQGRAFSVGDPEDLDDVIIYGAAKITKGVVEFGVWSKEMLAEIGKGIEPHLRKIFDAATKYEDDETTRLAGGKSQQQRVKTASKMTRAIANPAEQKKAFQDFKPGEPMTPDQLKTLWTRAMEYIKPDGNDMADVVYKVSEDLGIPSKDVLKGLNQSRSVKRVADDVWQKQRQARILKQSAKRWIETAQETWLQKALPTSAKFLFSAKVNLHGTVALGTHASLTAATHPVIFAENFGKMYKLVASPEYYQMQGKAIARRPNYNVAQRAGLVNDMAKMEDFNDPRLALRFPKGSEWFKKQLDKVHLGRLVGMGTRGYSVLKILRQDLFDHEWDKLSQSKQTPDMAKAIADSVNHITGVDKAKLPSALNYALFAPKLAVSRIKVIAGDPLRAINSLLKMRDMTDAEKWFATNQFKEKAKIFGTATGLLIANQQLNSLFGDKKKLNGVPVALGGAGINPMASDFMKFRVAGMNVAWGSPFLTMSRLPLRLVQIGKGNGGKSRFLIYPDESMYKTVGSYLRTQESPFMSPILSLGFKADWQERPLPQIPGYGKPPPVPKRLRAAGIKPYSWLEFGSEILMPIPVEEGVNEMWHYGLGSNPRQKAAMRKSFAITLLMAATGGRIQEDWNKPSSSATPSNVPSWYETSPK